MAPFIWQLLRHKKLAFTDDSVFKWFYNHFPQFQNNVVIAFKCTHNRNWWSVTSWTRRQFHQTFWTKELGIIQIIRDTLGQCFPTFFGSRHPYLIMKIFGGTLSLFHRYKDQVLLKIGGTPGTSSRHLSVPRHPDWEPLLCGLGVAWQSVTWIFFYFLKKYILILL